MALSDCSSGSKPSLWTLLWVCVKRENWEAFVTQLSSGLALSGLTWTGLGCGELLGTAQKRRKCGSGLVQSVQGVCIHLTVSGHERFLHLLMCIWMCIPWMCLCLCVCVIWPVLHCVHSSDWQPVPASKNSSAFERGLCHFISFLGKNLKRRRRPL